VVIENDKKGTGGLTFEPPTLSAQEKDFAADLGSESDIDTISKLFGSTTKQEEAENSNPIRPPKSVVYPLSEGVFARLKQTLKAPSFSTPAPIFDDAEKTATLSKSSGLSTESLGSFQVGPSIAMRKNDVVTIPPPKPSKKEAFPAGEQMLDAYFVGESDDESQVHLAFKDEVLGGVHVVLEQQEEGLFARFITSDNNTRRLIESSVHVLLQRLKDKGLKVSGYAVTLREAP